ncbi:MAG: hypothetical protein KME60_26290 [Cyanomargarita calcarea GSE-NOS-MK-12-04C]|jgi:hypothetical protein|uniref:vWA-MoxR associated protein C-terminal domain-containing protein n=1 Tax=Cyanomargarita calcarea GSE-NOS-MK-12-04C TaxID=2839659 RepID=A0A951QTN5_9CYAN|nr:hypothetical protein [Cyanomargarita calcarea GSE-NOS-MK-12-04C]
MEYNLGSIKDLIEKALTNDEFHDLVFDGFYCLHGQFTDGQSLPDRRRKLVEYADIHREIPKLLELIKKKNNTVYKEFSDRLLKSNILVSNFQEALISNDSLINVLERILRQEDESFWQCVKQVYQQFLLQVEDEAELEDEPDNLDELLDLLKDRTEQVVILEFIPRLIAYISIYYKTKYRIILNNLQQWKRENISNFKVNESDFNKAFKQFKKEYQQSSGIVYLIVEIKEIKSYSKFQISGWLGTDEIINNPDLDLISLDNQHSNGQNDDTQTEEKHYSLESLKENVRLYLNEICNRIKKDSNLIIEFFLPSSLLGWDVDKWELEPSDKIVLGLVHEVRIRSLDRLSIKYKTHRHKWKNKWTAVQKCRSPLQLFSQSHFNGDANTLLGQLQNEKIVGLKLISTLKSGHEGIASALYYSGTPIALWFRCEPGEGDCETELDNLLQNHLLELPKRVFQKRSQPECHISLIWDDPNRIIPNYQLQ